MIAREERYLERKFGPTYVGYKRLLGDGEVVHVYRLEDRLVRRMDVEAPDQ